MIHAIACLDAALRGGAIALSLVVAVVVLRQGCGWPIRDFLRSQPGCVAYAERMRERFFPEFARESQAA